MSHQETLSTESEIEKSVISIPETESDKKDSIEKNEVEELREKFIRVREISQRALRSVQSFGSADLSDQRKLEIIDGLLAKAARVTPKFQEVYELSESGPIFTLRRQLIHRISEDSGRHADLKDNQPQKKEGIKPIAKTSEKISLGARAKNFFGGLFARKATQSSTSFDAVQRFESFDAGGKAATEFYEQLEALLYVVQSKLESKESPEPEHVYNQLNTQLMKLCSNGPFQKYRINQLQAGKVIYKIFARTQKDATTPQGKERLPVVNMLLARFMHDRKMNL